MSRLIRISHFRLIDLFPNKDLSRVGLADSPAGFAGGKMGEQDRLVIGDISGLGSGGGQTLTSSAYYRRMRLHTASTLDLPVRIISEKI